MALEDPATRARARAALAEIALSTEEPARAADLARASARELERAGDVRNAVLLRLVAARAEILLGRLGEARNVVDETLARADLPADLRASALLAKAEIAIRSVSAIHAREALLAARRALDGAPHPLLARALVALEEELSRPVASLVHGGVVRQADLFVVEDMSRGDVLLVDACRCLVVAGRAIVPLARRRTLFALLLQLARAFPASVPRDELASQAFEARRVNESHRARLRVEIGRLRKLLAGLGASPEATRDGYLLASSRPLAVLLPPEGDLGEDARIALLLRDGAAWSARGLAEHAGVSMRTAQRVLASLVERGVATRTGSGNNVRYTRPGTPIASRMLLLGLLPRT